MELLLRPALGEALEAKIAGKISEFGGLLSRESALRLLCKENGVSLEKKLTLAEAAESKMPFSFTARVERIFPIQEYGGSRDRSVRLHLSDGKASATLLLWNEQADIVRGSISIGDEIECSGAYSRSGEIGVSRQGQVKKAAGFPLSKIASLATGACNVEGIVKDAEPPVSCAGKWPGQEKTMFGFTVCQGAACVRAIAWQGKGAQFDLPLQGDTVLLENAFFRKGELHLSEHSRLLVKKSAAEASGTLEGLRVEGDRIAFMISGRELSAPLLQGFSLLGVQSIPQGVRPETVASLLSASLAGKGARYFSSGNLLHGLRLE